VTSRDSIAGIAADLANIRLRTTILRQAADIVGDRQLKAALNLLHTAVDQSVFIAERAAARVPHLPEHTRTSADPAEGGPR
jgi:hypothetical protein